MRFSIVLAIIVMVSIAQAARTGIQAKLIHDGMGAKMQSRSLNKALTLMTEISASLNGDNTIDTLFSALGALKDNIQLNEATEIEDFQVDETLHKNEVSRLSDAIAKGEKSILTLNDDIESYEYQEQSLKSNLNAQETRLDEAKATRDTTITVIAKLDEDYENTKNDFGQCLNLLDQAIEKINEAKGWTSNFVQINKTSF